MVQRLRDGSHAVLDRQKMVYVRMGLSHEEANQRVADLHNTEMKAKRI